MPTKRQWRERMRGVLRGVAPEDLAAHSRAIVGLFLALPEVEAAKVVFTYISIAGEIDTRWLIDHLFQSGKTIAVPLITGPRKMEAHRIDALSDCLPGAGPGVAGKYGLFEPRRPRPLETAPDICITPGLAFTLAGGRLGKGGGYYDGFLARHRRILAIAFALDQQVVDELPMGPTDQHVGMVITPTRVIRCKGG